MQVILAPDCDPGKSFVQNLTQKQREKGRKTDRQTDIQTDREEYYNLSINPTMAIYTFLRNRQNITRVLV